ncbi:hypothetical protein Golob_009488 [Gossypium lobatum]|uniref:Uncharacterized protein n=1 Tax=Gossypium lobatum TaxID=34289 RepID=A0A7J8MIS8_9ROSI|nr:hypothetical protein [Gossypium lobatum]
MSGCSEASNGDISSNKKRKLDVPVRDITEIQSVDDSSGKACNVMRKLQKLVLKALQESGVGDDDKSQLSEMLEH